MSYLIGPCQGVEITGNAKGGESVPDNPNGGRRGKSNSNFFPAQLLQKLYYPVDGGQICCRVKESVKSVHITVDVGFRGSCEAMSVKWPTPKR